jgi:CRISPR-associated exonuclease Cas4
MLVIFLVLGMILLLVGVSTWLRTGLPSSRILSADVGSPLPAAEPLVSHRYGLTGKPDYLVQITGGIAPVELKSGKLPRNGQPRGSNVMQLAAYCLLVEDTMNVSVLYGIIKYRDASIQIPFSDALRRQLLALLPQIRAAKSDLTDCHRSHRQRVRCAKCGYRPVCSEAL